MAYDGWIEFGGRELINLSRTAQLAEALGIDTVWTAPAEVAWIQDALDGLDYDDISTAPWYDAGTPESAEFAGFVPLSLVGLDDSSLETTTTEYITDGGASGKGRNKTQPVVASVAVVGSTTRGADFGKRWLDRMLREYGAGDFCAGAVLRYFRYAQTPGLPTPGLAHRRNVTLTRGTSVTRKRANHCSATWLTTFTWTANDPFEYGEAVHQFSGLGMLASAGGTNSALNPTQVSTGSSAERQSRYSATMVWLSDGGTSLRPPTFGRSIEIAAGSNRGIDWYGNSQLANPGTTGTWLAQPVRSGEKIAVSYYTRWTTATDSLTNAILTYRYHNGAGAWVGAEGSVVVGSLAGRSGQWVRYNAVLTVPLGAAFVVFGNRAGGNTATGDMQDQTGILIERAGVASQLMPQGYATFVEVPCPDYDYSPLYDPTFPALIPSPQAPDFYPRGWGFQPGKVVTRRWVKTNPVEPSALNLVPEITIRSNTEQRNVRVAIWPRTASTTVKCDPLWAAYVTYLPPKMDFVVDGKRQVAYAWDGSASVRRTDSLVFGERGRPVDWRTLNDPNGLMVTVDILGQQVSTALVSVSLSLIPKSD